KVSGFSGGVLKSSAYVASVKDAMDDAGLTEMTLSLGFGIAAARNKTIMTKAENIPKRPNWRQSEIDAELDYKGYDSQKSFLNGEEVPYGTKGSSRPELYKQGHSIEVKNYNVQTSSGQNNLINNVSKQIKERLTNLPPGTEQTILIDVRGQNVSNDILKKIRSKILDKSGVNVEIIFKR
ncbi:hypothetical protein HB953_13885, partial [Listeria welshimeri]|nr:hypothetical protein [Listeria welshimeri]